MKRVASGILPMIVIDRKILKALHRQIYDAYRAAIVDGRLRRGQRIPSTRVLASEIGVSRFPVLGAYAQLLAEGYFESRVGAGTFVSSSLPDQWTSVNNPATAPEDARSGPRVLSRASELLAGRQRAPWAYGSGAFSVGQLAFDHFPFQAWS